MIRTKSTSQVLEDFDSIADWNFNTLTVELIHTKSTSQVLEDVASLTDLV